MPPPTIRKRATNTPRIAVIGGIFMTIVMKTERIPELGESINSRTLDYLPGGKGGNTAVAAYRASHNQPPAYDSSSSSSNSTTSTSASSRREVETDAHLQRKVNVFMNGIVGGDEFGKQLRDQLVDSGVDVSGVDVAKDHRSGTSIILIEVRNGESRSIGHPGAHDLWSPPIVNSVDCLAGDQTPDLVIAHLEHPRELIVQVLNTASRRGVDTLLNPSPPATLVGRAYRHVTHLVMNETEAAILSGRKPEQFKDERDWRETADYFLKLGAQNVVLTLGKKGVFYGTGPTADREYGKIDAVPNVKVMDSTGAGDTFIGTYAVEYVLQKRLGEWDIKKAIKRACRSSARTIQAVGCQSAIPWADEIEVELTQTALNSA